jgi:hypothetical protein
LTSTVTFAADRQPASKILILCHEVGIHVSTRTPSLLPSAAH